MTDKLKDKIQESLTSVLPITVIVLLLSFTLAPMEVGTISMFLMGAACLIVGMGLFQLGAEMAMTPLGQGMGDYLVKTGKVWLLLLCTAAVGVIITVAEPDLQVLAGQVTSIPSNILIWTVAAGVGVFLMLAVLRIYLKIKLSTVLIILYVCVILLSLVTPSSFLAVAFDAGGVTTGPMTVPFIMALGVGVCSMRGENDSSSDSFGLISLCSVGPIIMVMILGIIFNPSEATYEIAEVADVTTTQDVIKQFIIAFPEYAKEVWNSVEPVFLLLVAFQFITGYYRTREIWKICVGFLYTYVGLVLFLTGVNVGFAPVGNLLGSAIGTSEFRWILVPVGALIGYYIVKAEPAVQVLNVQVEEMTGGMVSRRTMGLALSIAVAFAVTLAMLRVLLGFSLYWIVIPGYIATLLLTRFVSPVFVGIAFDSGGVASGPMTSTFLLPLSMGVCIAIGGSVVEDAFGVIALVALAPTIAIQIMGLLYERKSRQRGIVQPALVDEIVEFEEW